MARIFIDDIGAPHWIGARFGNPALEQLAQAVTQTAGGVAGGLAAPQRASVPQRTAVALARGRALRPPTSRRLRFD